MEVTDSERVGAMIIAYVMLARRLAEALTRPRFNKAQAGGFLMEIASDLRVTPREAASHDALMEIVNGLETGAEFHFGVQPRH
jgi:hypothetical protein